MSRADTQAIAIRCDLSAHSLRSGASIVTLLFMTQPDELDDIDRNIVTELMANARATYAEIGADVGLSAPAVKRRVDRLVASGTISGFTAIIDPWALGWQTEAYIEIYCEGTGRPEQLRGELAAIPEILSACTVTGAPDALLHVLARDVKHLEKTLQRVRALTGVTSTKTEFVLSRFVQRS